MDNKTITIQEYELPITIQAEEEGGFLAHCPLWKDCYAQGETIEEAITEITYVASSLIEIYKEEDIKIPLKAKHAEKKAKKGFTITFPLIVTAS
ncbi:MAG: type II toxin-antitoxin system HicB family antitoxin [Patescibacteria group bacterium]